MSTTAKFYVDAAPELGEGSRKFTIDCKWGTTRVWWTPGELVLPERHVVSVLLRRHEDECGRCNLARLWREHGDEAVKAEVDRLHDEIQTRMVARHLAGRRN